MMDITYDKQNCDRHGSFVIGYEIEGRHVSYRRTWCPTCGHEKEQEALIVKTGQRYREACFTNFMSDSPKKTQVKNECLNYAENFKAHRQSGKNLVLGGPPGVGKNHLAVSIAKTLIEKDFKVDFCRWQQLLQRQWALPIESKEMRLNHVSRVDLLIVDEMDKAALTEASQRSIFELVDFMWREKIPLMLLTKLNEEGLKTYLEEDAFDRLSENWQFIAMTWHSHRQNKGGNH